MTRASRPIRIPAIIERASWRHLWRHRLQLGITAIGVTIGVAVVVAVDVANSSAQRAFHLSMEQVAGRATHQIVGGPRGLDESLYTRLRLHGVRKSAPALEGYGEVGGRTVQLLGVDPFAEHGFRAAAGDIDADGLRRLLTEAGSVITSAGTAARLGLRVGDTFTLEVGGYPRQLHLVGRIDAGADEAALDQILIADIATAQEVLRMRGRLSWIDLILPSGARGDAAAARIKAMLPKDAALLPAKTRTDAMAQMSAAFHTNLTAMSLLALIVGVFLIYNTLTFAVLQRRELFGMLRVHGVTRRELAGIILREAAVLGTAGTIAGVALGVALGYGLTQLVTRTLDDLYFVMKVQRLILTPDPLIKGVVLGLGASLLAAIGPAVEAARTAPRWALSRSIIERRTRGLARHLVLPGLALAGAGTALVQVSGHALAVGFLALFMVVLGLTVIVPWTTWLLAAWLAPLAGRLGGLTGRLAMRGISASLSRTGVAAAALALALATTVGVGIMIGSFRENVVGWLGTTLRADIFVSTPSLRSSRAQAALDPRVMDRLRNIRGIAALTTGRVVTIESRAGATTIFALDTPKAYTPRYRLARGEPNAVWPAFERGEAVVIAEPLAFRRRLGPGDRIVLRTDRGEQSFPIAGVYYDYESGPGRVLMHRKLYDRYFDDRNIGAVGIYLDAGRSLSAALGEVRTSLRGLQNVIIRSNSGLRARSLEIFDRTFTITTVLRMLSIIVAFTAILGALMALQLERRRELAVLRASGYTPRQTVALVLTQSGVIGLLAGAFSLPLGVVMARLLIDVINRRAFGWSMDTVIAPGILLQSLSLGLVAALLAGAYPAWRAARIPPAAALREE